MADLGCDRMALRDFTFAFNDSNFSDRILQIHVMPDSDAAWDAAWDGDGCIADKITEGKPDNQNDEMNWSCSVETDIPLRMRSIHVNSIILAEMSPFFHKLFSNGMRESKEGTVIFRICLSEEVAFMDLLQFMYSGKLDACSTTTLLEVLMVADKFQVTTCVHYCKTVLQNSPMSVDDALLYLKLPLPQQIIVDSLQSLIDAAKKFLTKECGDIKKFAETIMMFPLEAIEVLLSSNELIVDSEDALYDFVIKWSRKHYPDLEKRREIFGSKLCQLIHFPNMSSYKLKDVLRCDDLDNVCASKVVSEALLLKAEVPHKRLNERAYQHLPITVVELDAAIKQIIVFWNITKEQFTGLFSQSETRLYSQYFRSGSGEYQLWATCVPSPTGEPEFQISVSVIGDEEASDFFLEFAVCQPLSKLALKNLGFDSLIRFQSLARDELNRPIRFQQILRWPYSPADDSKYFNNNVIQFRLRFKFNFSSL